MTTEIESLERQIETLKERLAELRHNAPREEVADFEFESLVGGQNLSDLFSDKDELIVIHNMGKSCPYCTLWADGLNGQTRHYENRAAFVVCTPDALEVQAEFAKSRGWDFRMVRDSTKDFSTAMGFWSNELGWYPGASAFVREGDKIYRTGKVIFGPGDDFCGIWPMMDLLGGAKGWEPKYTY